MSASTAITEETPAQETELGLLPADWTTASIGDSCEKPEYGYTETATRSEVGPRFLRITDIQEGQVDWTTVPYCRCDDPVRSKLRLQPRDILVARIGGTTGKSFFVRECPQAVFASYLIRLRAKAVDPEFLYYFCQSQLYWQQVLASKEEKLKGGISGSALAKLVHPRPPLPEQRTIARVLRTIQSAVELQGRIVEKLRELKSATMAKLFREGLRGERLKQTEVGQVPESWHVVPLGQVFSIRYGMGQPPRLDPNGIPMIRATDIKGGRIVADRIMRIDRSSIPRGKKPQLHNGDILVVRSGAYTGDVAEYHGDWAEAVAGYDLVLSPSAERLEPSFFAQYLLTDAPQAYFRSTRGRAAQPHLNADQLGATKVPVPCWEEQCAINRVVAAAAQRNEEAEKTAAAARALFESMLGALMAGRIRMDNASRQRIPGGFA